jgi:geranylgeranyl diphosphate synthase, type II
LSDFLHGFDRQFPGFLLRAKRALENQAGAGKIPESLWRSMEYSALSPGKRLRPRLLLAVTETLKGSLERAYPLAAAIELLHAFTLVHDDLPLLDNDDWRRGRPTNHRLFGGGLALLAGDGLMAFAWEVLRQGVASLDPASSAAILRAFSTAAGPSGVIGGQVLEMELERDPTRARQAAEWEEVYRLKTGVLFSLSFRLGILGARGDLEMEGAVARALLEYSEAFGFAFQVADDIEDWEQDAGRINYSKLVGRENASISAEKRLNLAFNILTDCCGQAPVSPELTSLHHSLTAKLKPISSL